MLLILIDLYLFDFNCVEIDFETFLAVGMVFNLLPFPALIAPGDRTGLRIGDQSLIYSTRVK